MTQHDHSLDNDTTYDTACENSQTKTNNKSPQQTGSYRVVVTPDARVASLEPKRSRPSPRSQRRRESLPQTSRSSARQSRSRLRRHAIANDLRICITLTYRDLSPDPEKDLTSFLRDARRHYEGGMQWASVTEGGSEADPARIHHHVFLPGHNDLHKIASEWSYGDVHVGINLDDQSLRRAVNYVAKRFVRSASTGVRYRRSRGRSLQVLHYEAESLDQALDVVAEHARADGGDLEIIDPRCGGRLVVYWDKVDEPI
jgi:hypothetical protein